MLLVIDIPDEDYEKLKWTSVKNSAVEDSNYMRDLILNGTPFPLDKYYEIIDKYGHNPITATEKIDNLCIDFMRGVFCDYFAERIGDLHMELNIEEHI